MSATVRVMQLLGEPADLQTRRCLRALRNGLGSGFDQITRTIGSACASVEYADARDRNSLLAAIGVRRHRGINIVHAWDMTALAVAALAGASRIIFSPSRILRANEIRWLRAIMAVRKVAVICSSGAAMRHCIDSGTDASRCQCVRPGVDFALARGQRDDSLRQRLGLCEQDHVILTVGESELPAAHDQAVWAASILHALSDRWKVLLWGRGSRATQAIRLGREGWQPSLLRVGSEVLGQHVEFEDLLPAADLAMVSANGAVSTLPIAICMAAGIPVVATTANMDPLLEDGRTALLCPVNKPRLLARRALELVTGPQLRNSIREHARTAVFEQFPQSRYVAAVRETYCCDDS